MNVSSNTRTIIFWSLTGIALLVGIIHASSLLYVNDDCFISFRYAKNLVNGLGLVYNAGEHVEGYTNFLWTMLIAVGMKLNIDPVIFSTRLGIFFYSLNLLLFSFVTWRLVKKNDDISENGAESSSGNIVLALPLTTLALSLHHDFNVYATSGLETSMYTFFVCLGFSILLFQKSWKTLLASGFVFVLAMLTRPDGVIFLFSAFLFILLTQKNFIVKSIYFLLPSVLIFLPYWIWRYNYYGYFFPNTFYAKSADLTYYSQGLIYVGSYFKAYYVFALIIVAAIIFTYQRWQNIFSGSFVQSIWRKLHIEGHWAQQILLALLFILIYSFFILRVGGDFMFARFFIPITPALFFLMERLFARLTPRALLVAITPIILFTTFFQINLFDSSNKYMDYIADEPKFYPMETLERVKANGEFLHTIFKDLPVRIAFWAGQLRLIYYTDPYYALESSAGLTDPALAHKILTERGRPGHEKKADYDFLYQKGIHFFLGANEKPPQGQLVLNMITFGNAVAKIIIYDNNIMSALSKYPEIHFISVQEYLDQYSAHIKEIPPEQIINDYQFFKAYYFDHNDDRQRQQVFENYLQTVQQ